jgi:four helix bundle protein
MRNPNNLKITAHALDLACFTYEITKAFPRDERFGLTSQMRRCSVSVGSNIAEGCGRWTDPQLLHFLDMSCGSATELEFQARLAQRLDFGERKLLLRLEDLAHEQRKMNIGFANWVRRCST